MLNHSKVCIIIPFYNGDKFIKPCLESILANSWPHLTICIVDNSSEKTNVAEIANVYDNVKVIQAAKGIGFGKANNIGAEYALSIGAEYLIILNQDTILEADCISNLVKPLSENPDIGITAPITFTYDFQSIEDHFIKWYLVQCPSLLYDALGNIAKEYYPMNDVSGACMAIRSETVKKFGLFDPLYFMYMEDVDLCRKMKYLGFKIALVPEAKMAHAHSHTTSDNNYKKAINLQKRRSGGIFILKELDASKSSNLSKFLKVNLKDYLYYLTTFKFLKLLRILLFDIKTLRMLKEINTSRLRELQFKSSTPKRIRELV